VFYADLRHFELVENLDYDKVRIAEHLFSNCDVVTSTQVYPAAITQRTKRVRINTAVAVVPFNHTPRMTSDFALIDILSQGRLDLGIGAPGPGACRRRDVARRRPRASLYYTRIMPSSSYVLAIDQGTTSTRAILFDASGRVQSTAQIELSQHYPRPGWVEHDPEEIWQSVVSTCREVVAAADGSIAAIGVTNQRETTVLWERATGVPVHNAIVWQDRRTVELCERWRTEGLAETVAQRTGLVIDPYFSASKIRWLLDFVPGLRERAKAGEIAFGTVDSFLLWRLSAGRRHAIDATNASRTMLFDIRRSGWDTDLLEAFGIPPAILPEVLDTGADYGATTPELLGAAIPIAGMVGDQQAAMIG